MFQMRFYALGALAPQRRGARLLQLLYLGNGEVLRYEPDEADLLATERKVEAIWEAIERATAQRDWRPSPGRLCEWCAHQALCPAFGGTPPPLPADLPASLAEVPGVAEEAPPSRPASPSRPPRRKPARPLPPSAAGADARPAADASAPGRPRPDRHPGTGGTVSRYE